MARTRSAQAVDESRMTLVEHLFELRDRLVKSVLALAAAFLLVVSVGYRPIFEIIKGPYCDLPPSTRGGLNGEDSCTLYVFGVADEFLFRMRLSLIVALVLAGPIILYQLWAFIVPGLHPKERRYAAPLILSSSLLFGAGAAFAYLTLDRGLRFLLGFGGDDIASVLDASRYLNYVIFMLLAFGASFQFPLLLLFLELVGVVDDVKLRRWRRGMYFGVAVFAAVITPSQDPFTFLALAGPMWFFYEAIVLWSRIHARRKRRRAAASTEEWADDETSSIDDLTLRS
jgi:sec-independent protein translocase protein TatC